jgi:hypothetical protein
MEMIEIDFVPSGDTDRHNFLCRRNFQQSGLEGITANGEMARIRLADAGSVFEN